MEVITGTLWFEPCCPKCGKTIDIERGESGLYARCGKCNNEWSASSFGDLLDEQKWLEQFNPEKTEQE